MLKLTLSLLIGIGHRCSN